MLKFTIYSLYRNEMQEDWSNIENPGVLVEKAVLKSRKVVDDPSDNICIGAYGTDKKYYQFDSCEAYHADGFFSKDFDKHALWIESTYYEVPDEIIQPFKV
jgi:hypothetical protein